MTSIVLLALAASAGYAKLTDEISIGRTGDAETIAGVVHRVVDGDTLRLKGLETRIRIWGLNAPEAGTPGGSEATAALTSLALGEPLSCRQKDIDRYGRIVGQCFLSDGKDISAAMIASGTATEYCRYSGGFYGTC